MSYLRHQQIYDLHGDPVEASQVRDLRTCEPFRLVGNTFVGATIDAQFWTAAASGTGAANTQASGLVTTASGTANSGYAQMTSFRRGRFIFAHPHICRKAIRIPTVVVAQNTRRWGCFTTTSAPTPTDGFWFELSAAGVLSVNARNAGGTVTSVASGSFNGEGGVSYVVDTNVHAYEIHFYVMGVEFLIDNVRIHLMVPTIANLSSIFTLPICWNSENSGSGTTSGTIEVWSANMVREGRYQTESKYANIVGAATTTLKIGAGRLHRIITNNAGTSATIYDNTSAAVPLIGTLNLPANPSSIDYDCPFFTGLTIVTVGASCDLTVIYE